MEALFMGQTLSHPHLPHQLQIPSTPKNDHTGSTSIGGQASGI
jgi:hypothetical protein